MSLLLPLSLGGLWVLLAVSLFLGWQLLRQNGRMLLRLDELEKLLDDLETRDDSVPTGLALNSPTWRASATRWRNSVATGCC
jgi:hypothetical protein